jgi:hypothetical protein
MIGRGAAFLTPGKSFLASAMTFFINPIVFWFMSFWHTPCTTICSQTETFVFTYAQEFMKAFFTAIFEWTFGCHHTHLSRVFTIDHQTYQVCFACGRKLQYSWKAMSPIKTGEMPQTLASFCNSVHTVDEQFASLERTTLCFFLRKP